MREEPSRYHAPESTAASQDEGEAIERAAPGEFEAFVATLREQLPDSEVLIEPSALKGYSVDGVRPCAVVVPASVEATARTVALAAHHRLCILPRGGGAHLGLGGLPEGIDVVIDLRRLTRLLEHEAADLTCQTEAGITLAALQSKLAERGQRLALDPPHAERATIGGILASNASGPHRLRYGTARDLVIGLRTVQANGEIARSGGRVVKNVAGYDLNKLYIGSLGTLGIIVEANFKLHPLPAAARTLLLTFPTIGEAMQTVTAALGSVLTPSAIELLDAGAARAIRAYAAGGSLSALPDKGYILAFDFEGSPSAIARQMDEVCLLARKHGALMADDLEGQAQGDFWEAVRAQTSGQLTCKATMLLTYIASYMQTLEQLCQRYELEASVVGHAGNGILYIELRPAIADERIVEAITLLRRHAQEGRGSLVVERCPRDLKGRIDVWGRPGSDFPLMQRLKQQFDPAGVFVRGRFVGGL
jgi:glycolate oxidase FAD binding subunit